MDAAEYQIRAGFRNLDTARRQMFSKNGKTAEYDLVSKSLANLMRMWVED